MMYLQGISILTSNLKPYLEAPDVPKAPSKAVGGKFTGGGGDVIYFLLALGGTSLTCEIIIINKEIFSI